MPRAPQERSPNQRLREMIAACGMSYDAVARAVVRVAAENGEVLADQPVGGRPLGRRHRPWRAHGRIPHRGAIAPRRPAIHDRADRASRITGAAAVRHRAGREGARARPGRRRPPGVPGRRRLHGRRRVAATRVRPRASCPAPAREDRAGKGRRKGNSGCAAGHPGVRGGRRDAGWRPRTVCRRRLPRRHRRPSAVRAVHQRARSRREAFAAAAELAWLLGWKHHDLGQEGAAQAYYRPGSSSPPRRTRTGTPPG